MAGSFTKLVYHIVFSTKMREDIITPELEVDLYPYIHGIITGENSHLLKINGTENHIHILARIHPSISISEMMRKIKANSSGWIHKEKDIPFEWQRGYGAFSVSESIIPAVLQYIINQKEHHKTMTFENEYISLLKKHNIEYKKEYVWND